MKKRPGSSPLIAPDAAAAIATGELGDVFSVLGAHAAGAGAEAGWIVRAFLPGAEAASLIAPNGDEIAPMAPQGEGLFAVLLPSLPADWRFSARRGDDAWTRDDPYRFGPILGAQDEHYVSEGTHGRLWEVLGAHPRRHEGADGVSFAVWAPNARRVSVVGDFNGWDGRLHVMRPRGVSGVREIFVPGLAAGARYGFEVLGADGGRQLKADPVGFAAELRPETRSIVRAPDRHRWTDADWIAGRGPRQRPDAPISIYEVHLPSWRLMDGWRWPTWDELAERLVPYVRDMGFTHIEALPVSEHPFDGSWGYQPIGLFAPTARHGPPEGFDRFVEACHAAGIGLILDWVPGHFPSDPHGLVRFDGTPLYEHADPREGFHPDWNTLIYNFGRREVANFLIANARWWLRERHVDALRVDAVASMLYRDYSRAEGEWIPNIHGGRENLEAIAFLQAMNRAVYGDDPSVMTIAEESTAFPGVSAPAHAGGLGFGFKWNMGWMNDTLRYMGRDPAHRRWHHGEITFGLTYAFSENFVLPISHDEVVHGKGTLLTRMPGARDEKFAGLRAFFALMFAHPGKKLLFMGQEFAQKAEWSHERELDWGVLDDPLHAGVQALVRELNRLHRVVPALHRGDARADGFQWVIGDADDASAFAWLRHGGAGDAPVLFVANLSGTEYRGWRVGAPEGGRWRVLLDTDARGWGGDGRRDAGPLTAEEVPSHGLPQSLTLTLPPLSAVLLTPARGG